MTLVGPPGVGKTRLAIDAANDARAAFDDGVCFVSLVAVSDPCAWARA
ncbi:MAG: AAA family ATPase [Chloroflexi bacterium]|nr:AAA family ATPase [Chloroflexota bacterium]